MTYEHRAIYDVHELCPSLPGLVGGWVGWLPVTEDRVQTHGRLVQDQELRVV